MNPILLECANLFVAGILAGLETAVHYGLHDATVALPEHPQIMLRQGLVRRLRWLVPLFFVPTALTGIAVTVVNGSVAGLYARMGALLAIAIWIAVRIVGTVRINAATLDWDPDAPPQDWRAQISASERFHVVGTWAAILAFAGFLLGLALRLAS